MNSRPLLHVIFWLGYILFESYIEFAWISSSFAKTPPLQRWIMAMEGELSLLLIKVPLTYFTIYIINQPGRKRPEWLTVLLGACAFALATVLHRVLVIKIILPFFYQEETTAEMLFATQRVISSFLDLIFVVGIAVAIKQFRLYQQVKENEKGLLRQKLEAELRFLRNQTNPHFLFNTLNNIYALARKKADETPEVVLKLSKLLRFMLYESRKDFITIAEELRVLQDYIELEKIRYDGRLSVRFTKSLDNDVQPIAPLILLPFVENAFKHGAGETRFNSYIHIEVQLESGHLIFIVENSTDTDTESSITENIGLANVRRQLELMYPEHTLEVKNGKNVFQAILNINLSRHATVSVHHSRG